MRSPGTEGISRIVAFALVVASIAATASYSAHHETGPADRAGAADAAPEDPLARELARCRTIGMTARDDAACATAWAESRRRFFDYSPLSPAQGAR